MRKMTILAVVAIFSAILMAGCGGGGGGVMVPSPKSNAKQVTVLLHQGAQTNLYTDSKYVDPILSGKIWELAGPTSSLFHTLDCSRLSTPAGCGYPYTDTVVSQEWHNTHGLRLISAESQIEKDYFIGTFSATEWLNNATQLAATSAVTFDLHVNVLADDFTPPTTSPIKGGELPCDGAIVIDTATSTNPDAQIQGWNYWSMYRTNPNDGSKTYIKVLVAESGSKTVVVPVTVDADGYPESFIQPGSYTLEFGFGTSWTSTGDYKSREIRLPFNATADQGTTGWMCRNHGQRLAARAGLNFVEAPIVTTPEQKKVLNQEAMKKFFKEQLQNKSPK